MKSIKINVSSISVETGHKTYQHATSSAPQGQLQRQTLVAIGGQKRCPSVPASRERSLTIPVQPYTMRFYPEYRPQPEIKGRFFTLGYKSSNSPSSELDSQFAKHWNCFLFLPLLFKTDNLLIARAWLSDTTPYNRIIDWDTIWDNRFIIQNIII